jgi:hypothetical protein
VKDHKISKSLYDPDRVIEIIQSQGSVIEFHDETDDGMELGEELKSFVEDEYTYVILPFCISAASLLPAQKRELRLIVHLVAFHSY